MQVAHDLFDRLAANEMLAAEPLARAAEPRREPAEFLGLAGTGGYPRFMAEVCGFRANLAVARCCPRVLPNALRCNHFGVL
jgi:hypothetical protein